MKKTKIYDVILIAAAQSNALAYVGIYHSMATGRLASRVINLALTEDWGRLKLKNGYEADWRRRFGFRRRASYKFAHTFYRHFTETDYDNLAGGLKTLSPAEAFQLFFKYRY